MKVISTKKVFAYMWSTQRIWCTQFHVALKRSVTIWPYVNRDNCCFNAHCVVIRFMILFSFVSLEFPSKSQRDTSTHAHTYSLLNQNDSNDESRCSGSDGRFLLSLTAHDCHNFRSMNNAQWKLTRKPLPLCVEWVCAESIKRNWC